MVTSLCPVDCHCASHAPDETNIGETSLPQFVSQVFGGQERLGRFG
jgi:hypothetical protein